MADSLPRLELVTHFQKSAAAWAQRTRRNGQQVSLYAERCAEIVQELDQSLRAGGFPADTEYLQDFMAVSRLEVYV